MAKSSSAGRQKKTTQEAFQWRRRNVGAAKSWRWSDVPLVKLNLQMVHVCGAFQL